MVYGNRMLLWRGVPELRIYAESEPPLEVMEQALSTLQYDSFVGMRRLNLPVLPLTKVPSRLPRKL